MGLEYGARQPILDPDETRIKGLVVDQNDVHGSAMEMVEVIALLSNLEAKCLIDMQARFDWDAIDQEQKNVEGKMVVFVWAEVGAWDRKRTLTIFRKEPADRPLWFEVMWLELLQRSRISL